MDDAQRPRRVSGSSRTVVIDSSERRRRSGASRGHHRRSDAAPSPVATRGSHDDGATHPGSAEAPVVSPFLSTASMEDQDPSSSTPTTSRRLHQTPDTAATPATLPPVATTMATRITAAPAAAPFRSAHDDGEVGDDGDESDDSLLGGTYLHVDAPHDPNPIRFLPNSSAQMAQMVLDEARWSLYERFSKITHVYRQVTHRLRHTAAGAAAGEGTDAFDSADDDPATAEYEDTRVQLARWAHWQQVRRRNDVHLEVDPLLVLDDVAVRPRDRDRDRDSASANASPAASSAASSRRQSRVRAFSGSSEGPQTPSPSVSMAASLVAEPEAMASVAGGAASPSAATAASASHGTAEPAATPDIIHHLKALNYPIWKRSTQANTALGVFEVLSSDTVLPPTSHCDTRFDGAAVAANAKPLGWDEWKRSFDVYKPEPVVDTAVSALMHWGPVGLTTALRQPGAIDRLRPQATPSAAAATMLENSDAPGFPLESGPGPCDGMAPHGEARLQEQDADEGDHIITHLPEQVCLQMTHAQLCERIYHGGVRRSLRPIVWKYQLRYWPVGCNLQTRRRIDLAKTQEYMRLKQKWIAWIPFLRVNEDDPAVEASASEDAHADSSQAPTPEQLSKLRDAWTRIEKDITRTDMDLPFYNGQGNADTRPGSAASAPSPIPQCPRTCPRVAKGSNTEKLRDVLLTYVLSVEGDDAAQGYVQGMNDLMSPLLQVFNGDEVATFWCYTEFMRRTHNNFRVDGKGMSLHLEILHDLFHYADPGFMAHLDALQAGHLFFCYRWLLVWFKREFSSRAVQSIWEVLWTDYGTKDLLYFFALAIVTEHRDAIVRHLLNFEEVLKYINDLSRTMDVAVLLTQMRQLVATFRHDAIAQGLIQPHELLDLPAFLAAQKKQRETDIVSPAC